MLPLGAEAFGFAVAFFVVTPAANLLFNAAATVSQRPATQRYHTQMHAPAPPPTHLTP